MMLNEPIPSLYVVGQQLVEIGRLGGLVAGAALSGPISSIVRS